MDLDIWKPVREPGVLAPRIAAQIERLIADARLQPGDRLPAERELARLLQVSRPSLREAIRVLEARGRLDVRHGSGVWIVSPSVHEFSLRQVALEDLFWMREVLEVPAAGRAADHATDQGLEDIGQALGALESHGRIAREEVDWEQLQQLDIAFHMSVVRAAGNPFLQQVTEILHDMLGQSMETTLTIPGRLERSRVEHRRIMNAITAHAAANARRAMRQHIRSAQSAGLVRIAEENLLRKASDGSHPERLLDQ